MTQEMFEDFVQVLKKRNTILLVLVIVLSVALAGMTIFAFSEFEIVVEEEETTDCNIEQTVTADNGDCIITTQGDTVIKVEDKDGKKSEKKTLIICATVLLCVLLILAGVKYGISKAKNKNYNQKTKTNNDKEA